MSKNRKHLVIFPGIMIGLMISEIGLRAVGISYPIFSRIDGDLSASLSFLNHPSACGQGEAFVRINSAGLRDREHTLPKPENVLRIAVLGDSFAEALQVPIEDTFWAILERKIRGCAAVAGREPEMIYFGVSGYG